MEVPSRILLLEEFSVLLRFFICNSYQVPLSYFIKSVAFTKSPQHQAQPCSLRTESKYLYKRVPTAFSEAMDSE